MSHVTLSDTEMKDVAQFWRDFMLSGGEGEPPSAFQFEALNDHHFRDAFLFWQAGGLMPPTQDWDNSRPAYDLLGPLPEDYDKARKAIGAVVGARIGEGVEAEDTDAGTVIVLAHLIWLTLLGQWTWAMADVTMLAELNLKYAAVRFAEGGTFGIWHSDPLQGVAQAVSTLSKVAQGDPEKARKGAMRCFCVPEGSAAHEYIIRASRALAEKEGSRSE